MIPFNTFQSPGCSGTALFYHKGKLAATKFDAGIFRRNLDILGSNRRSVVTSITTSPGAGSGISAGSTRGAELLDGIQAPLFKAILI